MQLVLLCVLVLSLLQPGLLQDVRTEDMSTNGDDGGMSQSITELKNIVLAHSKQMVDFSQEVRGQLATINDTVNTLHRELESLAGEVAKNQWNIKQVNKIVKTLESEQAVSQNTSLQLAITTSQLRNELAFNQQKSVLAHNKTQAQLTALRRELHVVTINQQNSVLVHNKTQAQLRALHISLQRQCRQSSLEALQDSLAAHTRQLATATYQLSTGHQALEDGLTEQLQTVSSDCDNQTAELLQGQQTVLERLNGIEEKLEYRHPCEDGPGWRRVVFLNVAHPNLFISSAVQVYCNNETGHTEYRSCGDANLLGLPSGTYTIRPSGGSPVTVYCDMDMEECGGGVWTRVASYNYSDPSISCPTTWSQITDPFRGCAARDAATTNNCASTSFPIAVEFNQVCGEVIAIQYGHPDGFFHQDDIEGNYVEGVSITSTNGSSRQHIWTFAAYPSDGSTGLNIICPCSQPSLSVPPPPSFVGNNYFCDTAVETSQDGWHLDDPLWDGEGCPSTSTCCSFNNPPWFIATLPQHTTDDIEVRICDDLSGQYDDTAIVLLKLYIR